MSDGIHLVPRYGRIWSIVDGLGMRHGFVIGEGGMEEPERFHIYVDCAEPRTVGSLPEVGAALEDILGMKKDEEKGLQDSG